MLCTFDETTSGDVTKHLDYIENFYFYESKFLDL